MTDFDLDVDDLNVREALGDLRDDWEDAGTWRVESGAEYSVHIEYGRGPVTPNDAEALRFEDEDGNIIYRPRADGHPPYPFFRPAIREFQAGPEAFLLKNTELGSLDEVDSADEMVKAVSQALERQMKVNATAESGGRSPGTHPNHPQVQSGFLRARISAKRVG